MSMLDPKSPAFQPNFAKPASTCHEGVIKDVWSHNLEEEIKKISVLSERYSLVAMDTEFPGIVFHVDEDREDISYQTVRVNVNHLKMIQLGVTLGNDDGLLPSPICTWQFNFKFDLNKDYYAQDSIDLLLGSGIDFALHRDFGIDPRDFAEHITTSGLVLNEEINWVSFHSAYDFGYLLRAVTGEDLPDNEDRFLEQLKMYFNNFYDIKFMVSSDERMKGGLNKLADSLNVKRVGIMHQAGSDSMVTLQTFYQLKRQKFTNGIPEEHSSVLYGVGASGRQAGMQTHYRSHSSAQEPSSLFVPI